MGAKAPGGAIAGYLDILGTRECHFRNLRIRFGGVIRNLDVPMTIFGTVVM